MKVVNVKTETFTEEVENSKEPMLIDFYATWCERSDNTDYEKRRSYKARHRSTNKEQYYKHAG